MKTHKPDLPVDSNESLTLTLAEAVGCGRRSIRLTSEAHQRIAGGRALFEQLLSDPGRYVYGASTAPGNRAKTMLSAAEAQRQGETLRHFIALRPGIGGRPLPRRVVRMAILSRLTNALSGHGKLTIATAEAIAGMLKGVEPHVPREGLAGPGEVMALSWLLAPICDKPLAMGEAMALVNGSPFASAMVADVAITARRRLTLAEQVLALSAEAARIPLEQFTPQLADLWPEPAYAAALHRLSGLLEGAAVPRLSHQAPVSWRIIPNVIAVADSAITETARVASISLRALKDNPTILGAPAHLHGGSIASSGGYHDHFASRAIDTVNAILADLCALISRLVARLVSGEGLGLPHLLTPRPIDGVGTEYLMWTLTSTLARAQQAAIPAGLGLSLEDPGGNQSDIAQPAFIAYDRHLDAVDAFDTCLATLAITSAVANYSRGTQPPPRLSELWRTLTAHWDPTLPNSSASGEPLRALASRFKAIGNSDGEELSHEKTG